MNAMYLSVDVLANRKHEFDERWTVFFNLQILLEAGQLVQFVLKSILIGKISHWIQSFQFSLNIVIWLNIIRHVLILLNFREMFTDLLEFSKVYQDFTCWQNNHIVFFFHLRNTCLIICFNKQNRQFNNSHAENSYR